MLRLLSNQAQQSQFVRGVVLNSIYNAISFHCMEEIFVTHVRLAVTVPLIPSPLSMLTQDLLNGMFLGRVLLAWKILPSANVSFHICHLRNLWLKLIHVGRLP
mmetsp:Transcript_12744/g.27522  ORF Transcript_12744/g.27522 Transcript_12744/m.27522 type:complete len:103 (-) Transcript_12744:589-897(-)